MTDQLTVLARMLLTQIPFLLLSWLNCRVALKREDRCKQYLMPFLGLILGAAVLCLRYPLCLRVGRFLGGLTFPPTLQSAVDWAFGGVQTAFLACCLTDGLLLLACIALKAGILPLMKRSYREGPAFRALAAPIYVRDGEEDRRYLAPGFSQARSFLKTLYIAAVAVGAVAVVAGGWLYREKLLTGIACPAAGVIVLGELFLALDGQTRRSAAPPEPSRTTELSALRPVLRALFPDKLAAEGTTVSEDRGSGSVDKLLAALEASDIPAEEAYGRFLRRKRAEGLVPDPDLMMSGRLLLRGESVLFNDPFYYDLIPYAFYPMHRVLLRHGKVLIVLGRHGAEEDAARWCGKGLAEVTGLPSVWEVGILGSGQQEPDVGIVTRSGVNDLAMHEANREFFRQVELVILLEPSRLLTTAQIGLNSLVRHCRNAGRKPVFCSTDINCDGLLDALSHLLMTGLREVSATSHHTGTASFMIWERDGEHLQHRMLPGISRYLGVGTELSFAAAKHGVPRTCWYGGDAFPVKDIRWIARQYHYELMRYAQLPPTQDDLDRLFRTSSDMWSLNVAPEQYITVEDESCNMFEMKRTFSTRATEQSFINVICPDYLLRDYMADNAAIFDADPKAVPRITADYARTARNVVLRLCLRMSCAPVTGGEIRRELILLGRDVTDPGAALWQEICAVCGYAGSSATDRKGRLLLQCGSGRDAVCFCPDILQRKRRFDPDTGTMQTVYSLSDSGFIRLVLGALRPAEYIAEDDSGQRQYLGTELQGHVFQKYLPGQFFTFGGRYYEMLRVTSQGQVLVRRASDHIEGRPFYRQIREYTITSPVDSTVMGECRDMGLLRIRRQTADIRVKTPAYWQLKRCHDFGTATKVGINGVPERHLRNKSLIRIDLEGDLEEGTAATLALLINEVLRSLLAEDRDYLVALTAGEASLPNTCSLFGEDAQLSRNSIYLIEDSQMDIGLLDAVERNIGRLFAIISDYLLWHGEQLEKPAPDASARPAYAERCYLRYGCDSVSAGLSLEQVSQLLEKLGFSDTALTQARKGRQGTEKGEA